MRERVVATMRQTIIEAERHTTTDDLCFRHENQRSANTKAVALRPRPSSQAGKGLERLDELGPAIGIARIVERVHSNENVMRTDDFRPCKRQR